MKKSIPSKIPPYRTLNLRASDQIAHGGQLPEDILQCRGSRQCHCQSKKKKTVNCMTG